MNGALWPQLPPSQERPFYCPGLIDTTRIMSYKRSHYCASHTQAGHEVKGGSDLQLALCCLYFEPYIVDFHLLVNTRQT